MVHRLRVPAVPAALAAAVSAAVLLPARADHAAAAPASPEATPLASVIVLGRQGDPKPTDFVVEPDRDGRLTTLEDLFRGSPGVVVESAFGGIDHPRFAIRGSGLQRGTQPPGRGIELELDGLPMNFADLSFDFVEWIDPLMFDRVVVERGGRGVLGGASALGGLIAFEGRRGGGDPSLMLRGEGGSFGYSRAQIAAEGAVGGVGLFGTATGFAQDGYRGHNAQRAGRGYLRFDTDLSERLAAHASLLVNVSQLDLPGPLSNAQVEAASRAAQPGNLRGDWRRSTEQTRLATGLGWHDGGRELGVDVGLHLSDVDFRRRDVQQDRHVERLAAAYWREGFKGPAGQATASLKLLHQVGDRDQRLFLNGGGTMPTFTGSTGLQWADQALDASRSSVHAGLALPLADTLKLDLVAGYNRHRREIRDQFDARQRAAADLFATYHGSNGLALATWTPRPGLALFVAGSHIVEPPTHDVLLVNVAGTGAGQALVSGPDPRRPVTVGVDDQAATTVEAGVRGRFDIFDADVTLYRGWLRREIVSTADFVSQVVTSVGNADRTTRLGIEAALGARLGRDLLVEGDHTRVTLQWNWIDARFDDDAQFGDNRLPIVVPHRVDLALSWQHRAGWYGGPFATWVPDGGWVDYANSFRAAGYVVLGARAGWRGARCTVFAEGRNLTDARYASTVITASNNVGGMDASVFAPGELIALTIGLEARFD